MKKKPRIIGLIANHWLAKLLSLVLAVTLWAVIRRNVSTTVSPTRFQFEVSDDPADQKFQIDTRTHGERKR